jgi:hypothetical protein
VNVGDEDENLSSEQQVEQLVPEVADMVLDANPSVASADTEFETRSVSSDSATTPLPATPSSGTRASSSGDEIPSTPDDAAPPSHEATGLARVEDVLTDLHIGNKSEAQPVSVPPSHHAMGLKSTIPSLRGKPNIGAYARFAEVLRNPHMRQTIAGKFVKKELAISGPSNGPLLPLSSQQPLTEPSTVLNEPRQLNSSNDGPDLSSTHKWTRDKRIVPEKEKPRLQLNAQPSYASGANPLNILQRFL